MLHIVFQKELCNGKVHMHAEESWDHLKIQLADLDTFPTELFDRHFGWENLRTSGRILNDGSFLWQYFKHDYEGSNFDLFEGEVVFLVEIDPVFD